MTQSVIVDANVLIRYLLADHPQLSPRAKKLFAKALSREVNLHLDPVTVAETAWTLLSQYKLPPDEVSLKLKGIVSQKWLKCDHKRSVLLALDVFPKSNVDFIDAWIYAVSKRKKYPIASFDTTDFKKLKTEPYSW